MVERAAPAREAAGAPPVGTNDGLEEPWSSPRSRSRPSHPPFATEHERDRTIVPVSIALRVALGTVFVTSEGEDEGRPERNTEMAKRTRSDGGNLRT